MYLIEFDKRQNPKRLDAYKVKNYSHAYDYAKRKNMVHWRVFRNLPQTENDQVLVFHGRPK